VAVGVDDLRQAPAEGAACAAEDAREDTARPGLVGDGPGVAGERDARKRLALGRVGAAESGKGDQRLAVEEEAIGGGVAGGAGRPRVENPESDQPMPTCPFCVFLELNESASGGASARKRGTSIATACVNAPVAPGSLSYAGAAPFGK